MTTLAESIPIQPDDVAAPPEPFKIWRLSDFDNYVPPPDHDLLGQGLLTKGNLTLLVGHGGVGKSRLAVALAVAQITGNAHFCQLPLHTPPRKWLFIGSENSAARWKTDLEKLTSTLSEHERQLVEEYLLVAATFEDEVGLQDLSCSSGRIGSTIREVQPGAIVFDPWADLCPGDENKTDECRSGITRLRAVTRKHAPEAAALLIAHARPGRDAISSGTDAYAGGSFLRGNKALYNSCRSMLCLVPGDKEDSTRLVLICGKCNDGPRFEPRGVIFNPEDFSYQPDPDFDLAAWRDDVDGKRRGHKVSISDICDVVRSGNRTTEKIVDALKQQASPRTIKERLSEAVGNSWLIRAGKGQYVLGPKFNDTLHEGEQS